MDKSLIWSSPLFVLVGKNTLKYSLRAFIFSSNYNKTTKNKARSV